MFYEILIKLLNFLRKNDTFISFNDFAAVVERLMASASKAEEPKGSGGSNPSCCVFYDIESSRRTCPLFYYTQEKFPGISCV